MLAKFSTVLAVFAVAAQVAVATPPACLIAALSSQSDPSSIKAVCSGSNASSIADTICKSCGSNIETAFDAFSSVCKGAGVSVSDTSCSANTTSTTSSVASSTGTSSHHSSTSGASHTTGVDSASSGFQTSTANGTYTAPSAASSTADATAGSSDSGSSPAGPTATTTPTGASGAAASGPSTPSSAVASTPSTGAACRLGMDIVGMAAVGAFGAMLAL